MPKTVTDPPSRRKTVLVENDDIPFSYADNSDHEKAGLFHAACTPVRDVAESKRSDGQ